MSGLYPLKFYPIYKERIWGGKKFVDVLGRNDVPEGMVACGESWELSGLQGDLSVVSNGPLLGNNIEELIEIYMDELVGAKVYEKFGVEFPLLFKFLDTTDRLSIQVHPDDAVAKDRHHAWGKSELWYVVDAEDNAELIVGFNQNVSKEMYLECLANKNFPLILNSERARKDDVYYIPAGRLHAILEGFLIAEIQQVSDITYRIYDWDRVGDDGAGRELHTDLALDVLEYTVPDNGAYKTPYSLSETGVAHLQETPFFTINRIDLAQGDSLMRDSYSQDSFMVYMCLDGSVDIECGESRVTCCKGETVLVPASITDYSISSIENAKLLEVYL